METMRTTEQGAVEGTTWGGADGGRAPGAPGDPPRWAHADKDGVGTALTPSTCATSLVWFTLRHGVMSEVFYPRMDYAGIRGMELIVTDGAGFFSEELHDADHVVERADEAAPLYRMTNTCRLGRYRITKEVLAHPFQDAVLQVTRFEPLSGGLDDYRVYVVLDPQISDAGSDSPDDIAWLGEYKGLRMLLARGEGRALALASSAPWLDGSAGFVGASDGRRDLAENGRLTRRYERAGAGNAILVAEVDLAARDGRFALALGFGPDPDEAAHRAAASLLDDPDEVRRDYVRGWREWRATLSLPEPAGSGRDLAGIGAIVLRTHEAKAVPGAMVASLSVPWGEARENVSPRGVGGYHLVWPRDLCMSAGGYLAIGARDDAARTARYLRTIQGADGHWPQNARISGAAYWEGIQIGETAFPVLLLDRLRREGIVDDREAARCWPMVRRAVAYIARSGPSTQQDRWENETGYTPFTISLAIAAFLTAADFADERDEPGVAAYLRETADSWNSSIEEWLYVTDTELARRAGVEGYYARIMPTGAEGGPMPSQGRDDPNLKSSRDHAIPPEEVVSADALAMVRYGLRAPDDPRIRNTVRAIDVATRVQTPRGPCWRRYNGDGYGEHEDGSPYDGKTRGVGRLWPLLTGERAHYELAAGRRDEAVRLLDAMSAFAGDTGLLPEQVWDADPIPERGLFPGRPSGSAMPLVWAHAEYLTLRRSLQEGRIFDQPPRTVRRYLVERVASDRVIWELTPRRRTVPANGTMRIELDAPAVVRWTVDDWANRRERATRDTTLGVHLVDLSTAGLEPGATIRFNLSGPGAEGRDGDEFHVEVADPGRRASREARREP